MVTTIDNNKFKTILTTYYSFLYIQSLSNKDYHIDKNVLIFIKTQLSNNDDNIEIEIEKLNSIIEKIYLIYEYYDKNIDEIVKNISLLLNVKNQNQVVIKNIEKNSIKQINKFIKTYEYFILNYNLNFKNIKKILKKMMKKNIEYEYYEICSLIKAKLEVL